MDVAVVAAAVVGAVLVDVVVDVDAVHDPSNLL
jgi:hypothetical protein